MTEATMLVENKSGIHARPASMFVQEAMKFTSDVKLKARDKEADAKSILMIMGMGLSKGTEITITAEGPDEKDAVQALQKLVASKFGEEG